MIFDITIDDGAATSASISLTYRPWIPGRDPWTLNGSGIAGVTATDWEILKAAGRVNVFASFSGNDEAQLLLLTGFGSLGHDPAVGDSGAGIYSGPPGTFGQTDNTMGVINWTIDNIR